MALAYVSSVGEVEKRSKSVEIAINGSYDIVPDAGKLFDKVTVDVNVTETLEEVAMQNKLNDDGDMGWFCPASKDTNYSSFAGGTLNSTYVCYFKDVNAGDRYKVICSPMNPDNLWENFLFMIDTTFSGNLAVTANDESVGQYVTKIDDATYIVTIPEECAQLHINCTIADGCKMYLSQTYDDGYTVGVNDGKKSEYDAFWDAYQDKGHQYNHDYMFAGNGWKEKNINPKYDIKPTRANSMFSLCAFKGDLAQRFEDLGVVLDFSNCTMANGIFSNAYSITRLGIINFSKVTSGANWFINMTGLVTIDKLIVSENTISGAYTFEACRSLENLIIEGVIAKNGWDFQWSTKLSKASIESIISCLSSTTSGLSVTFSRTAVDYAFEEVEGRGDGSWTTEWSNLVATKPNWTISLV